MDVREKLVELLQDENNPVWRWFPNNMAMMQLTDYLIANGVTVQEWIPVNSPPKERGEYLCYFKYEPESPDVICQNTYYGSGRWMSEPDRVTHWQYLLHPPKGE